MQTDSREVVKLGLIGDGGIGNDGENGGSFPGIRKTRGEEKLPQAEKITGSCLGL